MLDTTQKVLEFIQKQFPNSEGHISQVISLSGGFINYVYRVSFDPPLLFNDDILLIPSLLFLLI